MNPSMALAGVLVESLAELGVRHVVLCPGSRSAPLAYAAAEAVAAGRLQLHVRIDERSAGFLALGLAKEDGVPAAVIMTSGTAVANLHPAVLEASHAGVPLIVLSADRPHELRGTGANQTTDQVKIFGPAVRWFAEIPAPERRAGQAAGWRNVMARAVAAARGTLSRDPGPVHLNAAFREPLVPDDDEDETPWPEPLTGVEVTRVTSDDGSLTGGVPLPSGPRTVVLAGDGAGPVAATLAASAGWPLLAEPSSGARLEDAVGPYRLLLDVPHLGGKVERVVVFGRPTLSRPVSRLLARPGVEVIVVSTRLAWPDSSGAACRVVPAVTPPERCEADADWTASWAVAGRAATAAIDTVLDAEADAGRLSGPVVAREVVRAVPPGGALVAGASNAIRDVDLTAAPTGTVLTGAGSGDGRDVSGAITVLANRGLAGIDGTLSAASGVALARAARAVDASELAELGASVPGRDVVRALVGDLTFLHDVGGLLVGPSEQRPSLQIVVLDDDGGGVFGVLEHGERARRGPEEKALFERVFATPTGTDLAALCAGYRVGYRAAADLAELRGALAAPGEGTEVVHVRIGRSGQADLLARLTAAALAAI